MARPRSELIVLESTSYYHCIARCVRRSFLCGQDAYSGQDFEHRRLWICDRLRRLVEAFAINLASYAIMSNHYHLVLHVDRDRALQWSRDEVIQRWRMLHKGPPLLHRYLKGEILDQHETRALDAMVECWRERLYSISWFMSRLNEFIARRANQEDGCKGRFWEGRFVSQGLLDDLALLSCMSYVDLNPIRAGLCTHPDQAEFTSIQQRLHKGQASFRSKPRLMPFREGENLDSPAAAIPFTSNHYLRLVEATGHSAWKGEQLPADLADILAPLGLDGAQWCILSLEVPGKPISMLHGRNRLASMARRQRRKNRQQEPEYNIRA